MRVLHFVPERTPAITFSLTNRSRQRIRLRVSAFPVTFFMEGIKMSGNKKNSSVIQDIHDPNYSYTRLVKKRLIEWKRSFEDQLGGIELNYAAIARTLEQQFGIYVSAALIGKMFVQDDDREVRLDVLTALAQLFNIPIWEICEHPSDPSSNVSVGSLIRWKNKGPRDRQPITNKFYEGDYYCYYFLPTHADDDIRPVDETPIKEATMSIRIDNGRTRLTFRQTKSDKGFYGNALEPYVLTGDLYRFEQSDIAYSFISNEDGRRFMALMFSYLEVATDIRYYMTMGMLTLSYNQTHVPLFQKMAVFRERQNLKDAAQAAVLRGILSLNSSPIILDSETCKKLIREDPVLENAFSPDKALLKDCMIFSEAAIRSSLFMISDKYDKTELLLKVRRSSLLPAHEIVSEEDFFARFIREYQIRQMQGSKEEHAPVNDTANENTYSL